LGFAKCPSGTSPYYHVGGNKFFFGDYMQEQIDKIIQHWAEWYGIELTADMGDALAKLIVEKFTSTNTGSPQCQHSFFSSTEFGFVECKYCGVTYPIEAQRAGA
jgi:hypothetical protein